MAYRWQIRIQSATVSRAVMEEMFTWLGWRWRVGQDEGHTLREPEFHTGTHVRKVAVECKPN